jgi:A/G-specific adenine glycosylase
VANPPSQLLTGRIAFRRALAAWFERDQRILPWRTTRSVYRTVVSEFMLQQTQVTTVLPYFQRWMVALPDFPTLAAASEDAVLKLWEGLGYYRRARNLHRLARELVQLDEIPQTAEAWQALPGIGPYTAAAVASLSFADPVACVDGNVVRILARLTGERRAFRDGTEAVKYFTPLAQALLDPRHPGRHNEAMMELGATICLRRNPHCIECPVARFCVARTTGTIHELPRIGRPTSERREVDRLWIRRKNALLLHRIPEGAPRMHGLCELPTAEQAGVDVGSLPKDRLLATHRRAITRYQITERIFRGPRSVGARVCAKSGLIWVPLDKLHEITLSGPHRRWVEALLQLPDERD